MINKNKGYAYQSINQYPMEMYLSLTNLHAPIPNFLNFFTFLNSKNSPTLHMSHRKTKRLKKKTLPMQLPSLFPCNSSIFLFFYFNPHHFRTQQKLLKAISNHGKFTNQSMHKKFTDQSIHKCKSTTLSLVCIITSPTVTLLISRIVSIFLFSRF